MCCALQLLKSSWEQLGAVGCRAATGDVVAVAGTDKMSMAWEPVATEDVQDTEGEKP